MNERSYATMDKSTWGEGEWQHEPDKLQWVDEATDLDCLIVRNRLGALCGYVGVPPEHPWHGKSYGEKVIEGGSEWEWDGCIDGLMDVHGGLTYSGSCQEGAPEADGICHVPAPGRTGDVWWFGFDCAHLHDVSPWMNTRDRERGFGPLHEHGATYKTVGYVRDECARLARQLREWRP